MRSWQLRMYEERNEAAARAEELDERVQTLTVSLERVRCTSKSDLLEQVSFFVRYVSCHATPTHILSHAHLICRR